MQLYIKYGGKRQKSHILVCLNNKTVLLYETFFLSLNKSKFKMFLKTNVTFELTKMINV